MSTETTNNPELLRLHYDGLRKANWKRWGPYLSERQWGNVREDYSADGNCWDYFPHDHARSRAYRWGEDGLLGITDRECRLCFALALWNGHDPILKERLFGLTNPQGNHGEDVKELYYYLDSTPTHSYMKALYKYPHAAYPYEELLAESKRRGRDQAEYEILDTGVLDEGYFDLFAEYAKAAPNDILIRITLANRGDRQAVLHLLPTLWFRNTWSWGCLHEGCWPKPWLRQGGAHLLEGHHPSLGAVRLDTDPANPSTLLFTENETNIQRLFNAPNPSPYVKDAFHRYLVDGQADAVNPENSGTKAAAHYQLRLDPRQEISLRFRLRVDDAPASPGSNPAEVASAVGLGEDFDQTFAARLAEADVFYGAHIPPELPPPQRNVARQAYAGLLWSKQFYHYVIEDWLRGDPDQPPPPPQRREGRNADWPHLFNRDIISMPDKWEYPWYAAWDLAFHMIPMATIDPQFAKDQLLLFLREWYMHPNGQLPAYEFALNDVNPPVHAWACWRVYKMTGPRGGRDTRFLARCFQKLLINFTWWVNRKDVEGKHIFAGGFLGLDNIGLFDRSQPLPAGHHLEQADGTAWMAFYCTTMLSMALELASVDSVYEDIASKFFEHFVAIADAINTLGGTGLWNDDDDFYYDQLHVDTWIIPLKIRSMVGLIPLFAVEILEDQLIDRLPGFRKRMDWFLEHRKDLAKHITYCEHRVEEGSMYLLAIPSRERLLRVLKILLDESEFLSPHGLRSLAASHRDNPFSLSIEGQPHRIRYVPGESETGIFGGNSNWRGPIWFPLNYLFIEALERYHRFYGDTLQVEFPTGSGQQMNLQQVAAALAARLCTLFLPDEAGRRPCHGDDACYADNPHFCDLLLFHEHFHGDTGRGIGASHQTGWTALITRLLPQGARGGHSALSTQHSTLSTSLPSAARRLFLPLGDGL